MQQDNPITHNWEPNTPPPPKKKNPANDEQPNVHPILRHTTRAKNLITNKILYQLIRHLLSQAYQLSPIGLHIVIISLDYQSQIDLFIFEEITRSHHS